LQSVNGKLPVNIQSWSYRLASGADLGASDFRSRLSLDVLDQLDPSKGSILVGEFFASPVPNNISDADNSAAAIGSFGQTADTIRINRDPADQGTRYEVIRTGTGTIDVIAGRDVQSDCLRMISIRSSKEATFPFRSQVLLRLAKGKNWANRSEFRSKLMVCTMGWLAATFVSALVQTLPDISFQRAIG
jgi:hypothetical protein